MSCDNGFNYAGVFGCNVVAAMANAFHVEQVVMTNLQYTSGGGPTGLPTGAVYVDDTTWPGIRVLVII
jgi:hypothetical protein